MLKLDQSKWDVHEWLTAATSGYKPDGKSITAERVEVGSIVTICYSGGSHFGSGGYYAGAVYAGEEPEFVEYGEGRRTSFIADIIGKFKVKAPSVIYEYSGDSINGGRTFTKHATICATDEQIEEAKRVVAERRRAEAEAADFGVLKKHLKDKWEEAEAHARQWHSKGCCWYGQDAGRVHNSFSTYWETHMLSKNSPSPNESVLASLPKEVAAGIRKACLEGKGPQIIEEARAVRKAEGQAFARQQITYLTSLGFSQGRAARIMRAAGPGQVRAAVEWAYQARETIRSWPEAVEDGDVRDALDVVLSGSGGTNGFGKDRMAGALKALGLPVPYASTARVFFGILAGAKEALLAGLPEREPAEA